MEPDFRPRPGDYLHLSFRVYRDRRVEVLTSFHLPGESEPPPPTLSRHVALELRADDGGVLGFHRCHATDLHSDPDAPFTSFAEMLPWTPAIASIVFLIDGEEADRLEVEEHPPELAAAPQPEIDRGSDMITFHWNGVDANSPDTRYLVRYSADGGATWRALAAGLREPRLATDLRSLPGGDACLFQVVASAGIRTTVVESSPLAVEVKPRRAYLFSPEADASFAAGESLVLAGVGFSPDFGTAAFEDITWSSNVAGFLGYGYELTTHTLERGVHIIRMTVADGVGGEASAQVRIAIEAAG